MRFHLQVPLSESDEAFFFEDNKDAIAYYDLEPLAGLGGLGQLSMAPSQAVAPPNSPYLTVGGPLSPMGTSAALTSPPQGVCPSNDFASTLDLNNGTGGQVASPVQLHSVSPVPPPPSSDLLLNGWSNGASQTNHLGQSPSILMQQHSIASMTHNDYRGEMLNV